MNHSNIFGSFPKGRRIIQVSQTSLAYSAAHQTVPTLSPHPKRHRRVPFLRRSRNNRRYITVQFPQPLRPTSRTTIPNENTSEAYVGRVPETLSLPRTSGAHQRMICCGRSSGFQTTEHDPKSVNIARPSSLTKIAAFRRQSVVILVVDCELITHPSESPMDDVSRM